MSSHGSHRDAVSSTDPKQSDQTSGQHVDELSVSSMDGLLRLFIQHLRTTDDAGSDLLRDGLAALRDVLGAAAVEYYEVRAENASASPTWALSRHVADPESGPASLSPAELNDIAITATAVPACELLNAEETGQGPTRVYATHQLCGSQACVLVVSPRSAAQTQRAQSIGAQWLSVLSAIADRESRTPADERYETSTDAEPHATPDDRTEDDALRNLFEISHIGTAIVNTSAEIIYANPAILSMFVVDTYEQFRSLVNELISDHARAQLSARMQPGNRDDPHPSALKISAATGTGRAMILQADLHPVVWESENAFCLILIDVTDDHIASQRMDHLEKMNALGQLSGGIAHDLNNLLTVVITNLELIRADTQDLGIEVSDCIDDAQSAARDGTDLTGRLLSFSRRDFTASRDIEMAPFVEETSAMLRPTLGEQINLSVDVDSAANLVCAVERDQFRTSLINLTLNARDAMPDGGHLSIAIEKVHLGPDDARLFPELSGGDYMKLSVKDTGSGMSRDVVTRSVEPFFTTKKEGKGTGLGLSSVYGFVRRCHGALRLESFLGRGTTATLFLPLVDAAEIREAPIDDDTALLQGAETILVVEDEPKLRSAVARALKKYGYQVLQAEDARDALREIGAHDDIDLVFSDVIMPGGMTGHDLSHRLAETKPDMRVALTTGYSRDLAKAVESPRLPVLKKPYQITTLLSFIRQALDADHQHG